MPIDPRLVKWDDPIDPGLVQWDAPKDNPVMNFAGGLFGGAADIGATLLTPLDWAVRKLNKDKPIGIGGADILGVKDRRADAKTVLQSMGVDPESLTYQGTKLGTELAGTAGVGGVLAKGAKLIGAAPEIISGLQSGGMVLGNKGGFARDLATRASTGAATGAASAGLINPEDAATGAAYGAVLPGVSQVIAGSGGLARNLAGVGTPLNPQQRAAAQRAIDAGLTVPPTLIDPSLKNQVLESISGKIATEQVASMKSGEQIGKIARKAIGLAEDSPLDFATISALRSTVSKPYAEFSSLPKVAPVQPNTLTNTPGRSAIDPAQMVTDWKQANSDARTLFASYNRSLNPEHLAQARAADALGKSLETQMDDYARAVGRPGLYKDLQEARKELAKIGTIERAMNPATGNIDPKTLGALFKKGKPLSDGLETIGEFSAAFPKFAKNPDAIGSPATHNLKAWGSGMGATAGTILGGPLGGMAGAALPFVAPNLVRSAIMSPRYQRGLLSMPGDQLDMLLTGTQRAVPLLASD